MYFLLYQIIRFFWFALYIEKITRMTANMEKEKMAALSVSNVGRMKFGQDFGPFQVVEYWGNVSNRGGGSDISLVVNSFNNQIINQSAVNRIQACSWFI